MSEQPGPGSPSPSPQPFWSPDPVLPEPLPRALFARPDDPQSGPPPLPQPQTVTQPLPPPPLPVGPRLPVQLPPRRRVGAALVAALASLALIAGLIGGAVGSWLINRSEQPTATTTVRTQPRVTGTTPTAPITRPQDSVAGIAAAVLPSVVQIEVATTQGEGSGSGFVMDDQGHILTNSHVVAEAAAGSDITVVFDDGSREEAKLIGRDAAYDLAVLQAETGSRPALELGDSDQVVVGDPVIAIGAPLGLQGTVTTGIVSAVNRPVSPGVQNATDPATYINAIQTDAAINPGNSGGPLVDAQGLVIGINSAIAQSTAGGLGFAIPSNQAARTAQALIANGVAEYPVIGVSLTEEYQGEGVKVAEQSLSGEAAVTPNGPADKAGVEPGDVIVALDGRPMTSALELIVAVRSKAVGETVTLTVRRDGKDVEILVTLAAAPRR